MMDRATRKQRLGSWRTFLAGTIRYVFLSVCVLIAVFPLIWVIMSSFKTNAEILTSGISLPTSFTLDGYTAALRISPILRYFGNSLVVAFSATFLNVSLIAMAAYVFARLKFAGKDLLFTILCISLVIPMTALLHPVYSVISAIKLADTKAGLIITYASLSLPMSLLILRATFQSIPLSIEEAAYVDGASFFRTFIQIMMPCAKGGLASAGVLCFLNSWNEFTFALVLTKSSAVRTLPLSLSYFTSQFSFNYTAMFAAITIAVIPSITVFAVFQEQVISSLTAGSLKE